MLLVRILVRQGISSLSSRKRMQSFSCTCMGPSLTRESSKKFPALRREGAPFLCWYMTWWDNPDGVQVRTNLSWWVMPSQMCGSQITSFLAHCIRSTNPHLPTQPWFTCTPNSCGLSITPQMTVKNKPTKMFNAKKRKVNGRMLTNPHSWSSLASHTPCLSFCGILNYLLHIHYIFTFNTEINIYDFSITLNGTM